MGPYRNPEPRNLTPSTRTAKHEDQDPAGRASGGWRRGSRCCLRYVPVRYRSTSPIRKRPPPYDPPRHGPTLGSYGVAFSYQRGTPVCFERKEPRTLPLSLYLSPPLPLSYGMRREEGPRAPPPPIYHPPPPSLSCGMRREEQTRTLSPSLYLSPCLSHSFSLRVRAPYGAQSRSSYTLTGLPRPKKTHPPRTLLQAYA